MAQDVAAWIEDVVYDAFNEHDLDRWLGAVTDDHRLEDVALGITFEGKDGLRQWAETWFAAAPDAKTEVLDVIAQGDWIATEHVGRATHTGPLVTPMGEIPPTGRRIELRFAELFHLRDGKIALMRAYWDSSTLMRRLGVIE